MVKIEDVTNEAQERADEDKRVFGLARDVFEEAGLSVLHLFPRGDGFTLRDKDSPFGVGVSFYRFFGVLNVYNLKFLEVAKTFAERYEANMGAGNRKGEGKREVTIKTDYSR
jgi:hypothetical protein